MILAGILLKMGGYGIFRIAYPLCPRRRSSCGWLIALIGVVSIIYGAFARHGPDRLQEARRVQLGQPHGLRRPRHRRLDDADARDWAWGMNGALFMMIAHGITQPAMFFVVGVIYDRAHHRELDRFGGLATTDAGLHRLQRRRLLRGNSACRGCAGSSAR